MIISRTMFLCVAALALVPVICRAEAPLRIAKQGSMEAGGRTIDCRTNDGGDPNSTRWPSGHVVVDNVYATYQYPADQRILIRSCSIPAAGTRRGSTTPRPTAVKAGSRCSCAKDLRSMASIARTPGAPVLTSAGSTR